MGKEEELKDIEIVCRDCKKTFIHSIKDQIFYKEMNFQNMPKACPECRKAKKEASNKKNRYENEQAI